MRNLQKALQLYHLEHGVFPQEDGGGWENSKEDSGQFLDVLVSEGYLLNYIVDPINEGGNFYLYYQYPAGYKGCSASEGDYYVLMIIDMETSSGVYPGSPGWECPNRNWQNEAEWVTGRFE